MKRDGPKVVMWMLAIVSLAVIATALATAEGLNCSPSEMWTTISAIAAEASAEKSADQALGVATTNEDDALFAAVQDRLTTAPGADHFRGSMTVARIIKPTTTAHSAA